MKNRLLALTLAVVLAFSTVEPLVFSHAYAEDSTDAIVQVEKTQDLGSEGHEPVTLPPATAEPEIQAPATADPATQAPADMVAQSEEPVEQDTSEPAAMEDQLLTADPLAATPTAEILLTEVPVTPAR